METKGMGSIDISDNAIREIALRSVFSVLEITDERKQKKIRKSLEIDRSPEDNITINLKIGLPFGKSLIEMGQKIMERVKMDIERMTELQVVAVNVTIEDIEEGEEQRTEEKE
ncbi:MAG TPA: Asp23/Gls24 family envelope stress response protein [Pseudothermotoga sp.]|nr:Asp23/Gls24 family envelope stress response protein [Pseudothermotoga sp.]HOK83713.1 Asp23/Gls24 family envelope stress response protein [Pseudothermotoga sp.]HPP69352.1 Asp23/Gls24 family envelope stress response protein [Pseudothermotoga sp.]